MPDGSLSVSLLRAFDVQGRGDSAFGCDLINKREPGNLILNCTLSCGFYHLQMRAVVFAQISELSFYDCCGSAVLF